MQSVLAQIIAVCCTFTVFVLGAVYVFFILLPCLIVVNLLAVLYYQALVAPVNFLALQVVDGVILRQVRYGCGYAGRCAVIESEAE